MQSSWNLVPTIHPSAPTSSIPLRYIILQYGYTCIWILHLVCEDLLLSTLRCVTSDRSIGQRCQVVPPFVHIHRVSLWWPIQIIWPRKDVARTYVGTALLPACPFCSNLCHYSLVWERFPSAVCPQLGSREEGGTSCAQILAAHPWKGVVLSCGKSCHFQGLSSFCFSLAQSNKRGAGSCVKD
jgi:hypothetical protein